MSDDEGVDKISFEFDIDHPLYLPLFYLLNYDDELLIDDGTGEDFKKYLKIYKDHEKIFVDFIDKFDSHTYFSERFYVFIKNILYDGHSKIDQNHKDTNARLSEFFREAHNVLTCSYHQMTIEEWLLRNCTKEKYDHMKRVLKRLYS